MNAWLGFGAAPSAIDETTRCWMLGFEHTRAALQVKAHEDAKRRHTRNALLPRRVFEFSGAHVPARIRTNDANVQTDKDNCYLNA